MSLFLFLKSLDLHYLIPALEKRSGAAGKAFRLPGLCFAYENIFRWGEAVLGRGIEMHSLGANQSRQTSQGQGAR